MPLHRKILIGLCIGVAFGLVGNLLGANSTWLNAAIDYVAYPIGQIFLRLLLLLVIPIVFAALVIGICELELKSLGKLGLRLFAYTLVVSSVAVLIGLVLVNVLQPGRGMDPELRERAMAGASVTAAPAFAGSPMEFIVALIPSNPIKAAADGDMLGVIVCSLLFGIGLALTQGAASERLREGIQGLYDVLMRLIELVLKLAPLGVAGLMFTMTARMGLDVLVQLAAYVGVVLLGLGIHMFVVYSISVRFFGGMSPLEFFRGVRLAIATAFSTASSAATLPTALQVAEENLHLPRKASRFVLTAGSTLNQNGTALFEGVTVLFLTQLYGVELALEQQVVVMALCILAGIGTAGVPAGSLPVIATILTLFGVPAEGIGIILGVDRLLDMSRTVLNVTGDLAAAVYVSRSSDEAEVPDL